MIVSSRALAHVVTKTADALGAPLPKTLLTELDRVSEFISAAEQIPASGDALVASVLSAISDGRTYHDDPEVTRQLLDHTLVSLSIGDAARGLADSEIASVLVEYADETLTAWSVAVAPHSAALVRAAEALPDDLDDVRAITRKGTNALQHWASAQDALRLWSAVLDGVGALRGAARLGPIDHLILMSDADLASLAEVRVSAEREGTKPDAWTLARHSITPRLVTGLGEIMERSAALQQQRAEFLRTTEPVKADTAPEALSA